MCLTVAKISVRGSQMHVKPKKRVTLTLLNEKFYNESAKITKEVQKVGI